MNVFIADDSILIRNILEEILSTDPNITVVGKAANGADAVTRVLALHPDIVIMDLDMPIMNGLEASAKLAEASSIPVLIFTHNTDPEMPFKALQIGAVDFVLKPDFNDLNKPEYVGSFIEKLKMLSYRQVVKIETDFDQPDLFRNLSSAVSSSSDNSGHARSSDLFSPPDTFHDSSGLAMITVGASTGGPQAVIVFLKSLTHPFPLPITLVQHIETGFDKGYADWLSEETGHSVILAKDGMKFEPGIVYVAPTDFHLKIHNGCYVLDNGPKVLNQKPSVNVLFESAADYFGPKVIAVLLTGMGTDGAEGCAAIQEKGGFTIVQNEATSLIFGMPKAAIDLGAASIVLPLDQIGPFINVGRQ